MDAIYSEPVTAPVAASPSNLTAPLHPSDRAIFELGLHLKQRGYRFTTISPASHCRVNARDHTGRLSFEDILGWNRAFFAEQVAQDDLERLEEARVLKRAGPMLRSTIRFSTLGQQLFVHSSFPTDRSDAVFFGPDTYRFARFIDSSLDRFRLRSAHGMRILDVGAGSGAGGLHAAACTAELFPRIRLSDINRRALRFSAINAAINSIFGVSVVKSDLFGDTPGAFDLIIANPPYLNDPLARMYRHGGGALGFELSLRIATEGLSFLARGGRLLLYTGSAIVNGSDLFRAALLSGLAGRDVRLCYEEIDPDVFGEELDHAPYDRADRLAVVGVTIDVE